MTYRTFGRRLSWAVSPLVTVITVLVHSNVFIAVAATAVAVTTILLADLPVDPLPLFIVFGVSLFVYSFNRVADLDEDEQNVPERARFTRRYGVIWLVSGIVLYIAAVGVAIAFDLPRTEFLVLPLLAAIAYSVLRVKRLLVVKNLLVGTAWGIIPLGVGVYYGVLVTVEIVALAVIFTVMLTVAAAIFDIKDIPGDRRAGISTVPIVYGYRTTRRAGATVTVLVAIGTAAAVALGVLPAKFLVLLGYYAYVLAYIPFASPDRGPLFYGFVVDGEHVFLAVLVLLIESL